VLLAVSVLVGAGLATSSQFGLFNLAFDLTALLGRELIEPLSRGLFPGYSRLSSDRFLLARVFVEMLGAAALILLPAGFGLAMVSDDFVSSVLGERWRDSVVYIQIFAIAGAFAGINNMMNFHILIAAGYEARAALSAWFRLFLFVPAVLAAGWLGGDLLDIARVSLHFELFFIPVSVVVLRYSIPVSVLQIAGGLVRPLLATAVMVLALWGLSFLSIQWSLLRLLVTIGVGVIVYLGSLYAVWRASGRPGGGEALLFKFLQRRIWHREAAPGANLFNDRKERLD